MFFSVGLCPPPPGKVSPLSQTRQTRKRVSSCTTVPLYGNERFNERTLYHSFQAKGRMSIERTLSRSTTGTSRPPELDSTGHQRTRESSERAMPRMARTRANGPLRRPAKRSQVRLSAGWLSAMFFSNSHCGNVRRSTVSGDRRSSVGHGQKTWSYTDD